jgi:hypothetical protein
MYHARNANGTWSHHDVVTAPDGYVAGDGARFTGFSPQLSFDPSGRATIVFSDEAAQHLPATYANEFSGQIRVAAWAGDRWQVTTVYRQANPLVNQLFYPVAATYKGRTTFAGLRATSRLDGNRNVAGTDFALVDVGAPAGFATPIVAAPAAEPVPVIPNPSVGLANSPGASPTPGTPPADARPSHPAALAVGMKPAPGVTTTVAVYRSNGSLDFTITPFGSDYTGGARVARGDVTGDGVADVIVGSGGNLQARVRIWDGMTRALIFDSTPFGDFSGGLVVAAGDVNRDGRADVVIGPDLGGGPRLQLIDGRTLDKLAPDFLGLPYPEFRGGLRLAVGDVNRDGFADVIVGPGEGGGPRVTLYDGKSFGPGRDPRLIVNDFLVFDADLRSGLNLTAGDVDGDGHADIVAGAGVGGAPRVRVISGAALTAGLGAHAIADFYANDLNDRGGVTLGVTRGSDGTADIITGTGQSRVNVYSDPTTVAMGFDAFPAAGHGVYVG